MFHFSLDFQELNKVLKKAWSSLFHYDDMCEDMLLDEQYHLSNKLSKRQTHHPVNFHAFNFQWKLVFN